MRHLPNIISFLRILLVIPVVWALLHGHYAYGLLLFAVAGISDGLDGFLAKRYGWQSHLGSILDPIADKLLLVASFVVLGYVGLIHLWLVVLVILRDAVITFGALAYLTAIGKFTGEPSYVSKINTFMQILLVLTVVFNQIVAIVPPNGIILLSGVVAGTTIASGIDYVVVWGKRARAMRIKNEQQDQKTQD